VSTLEDLHQATSFPRPTRQSLCSLPDRPDAQKLYNKKSSRLINVQGVQESVKKEIRIQTRDELEFVVP
jgi:hypothetical protein